MKFKLIPVILTAALTSVTTLYIAGKYQDKIPFISQAAPAHQLPVNYASYTSGSTVTGTQPADFTGAAEASVKAVVHIKTKTNARVVTAYDPNDVFSQLFGQRQNYIPPQQGSGSGVVVSPDGYIATNNHVVAGADMVTVTFNDRYTTDARVVATDAATDIAVLKVDDKNLQYMEFGNSDDVKLGQWVLAVGYPLTLDATVTAGIVSAKGRSIGINRTQSASAIESFIQTDAAVNPGNSGGALVNTQGQLIGINSAIASPTGSYAGYSYAIPSNIARKVVNDLMQYGAVQRAYMGIQYLDRKTASPEIISNLGLDRMEGVYVHNVMPEGGAEAAGIKSGDFITAINGTPIRTEPEMQEQVARYKPGDNISVTYLRNGVTRIATVQLKNVNNTTNIIKESAATRVLGASFKTLGNDEKRKYGISGGVQVTAISRGALAKQTNMQKGFVITGINGSAVNTIEDLQKILAANPGNLQIAGFYPGLRGMYYYGLNDINNAETGEQ